MGLIYKMLRRKHPKIDLKLKKCSQKCPRQSQFYKYDMAYLECTLSLISNPSVRTLYK